MTQFQLYDLKNIKFAIKLKRDGLGEIYIQTVISGIYFGVISAVASAYVS